MNSKIKGGMLALMAPILIILLFSAILRTAGFHIDAPTQLYTPALAQSNAPTPSDPLVLTDGQGNYPLGLHMELLEDPSGKLSIDDVSSPAFASRFTPSQVAVPNYGYTNSAYWLRMRLRNEASLVNLWLLEVNFQNLNYVDLYIPSQGGGYSVKQSGVLRPFDTRDLPYHHIVFELPLANQDEQTIYIHVQTGSSMTLAFTLWSPETFATNKISDMLKIGLFYGGLLIMLAYHLFLFYSLREAIYFYFVLFLAASILFFATYEGVVDQYLWPGLSQYKLLFLIITMALFFMTSLKFSDAFLEQKTRAPLLHRFFNLVMAYWGLMIVIAPFASYLTMNRLTSPFILITLAVAAAAGFYAWRKGYLPARFFLVSWLGFILGILTVELVRLGILPSTRLTEYTYQIGLIWLVIMWSLALANRINLLKAETEGANLNLQNSERRLSQILDGMPLGVVLYGKDYQPKYFNRRTVHILGNPAEGIQPDVSARRTLAQALKYFSIKQSASHQDYPLEDFPTYKALQGAPAHVDDAEVDQAGSTVALEFWANPIRDRAGNVESAVVALEDITQRRQMQAELDEYRQQLEALVEKRTAELNIANEQLRLRLDWSSEVDQIHKTVSGMSSLARVYEELSARILQLLGAALVFILRWETSNEQPEVLYSSLQGGNTPDIGIIKASFQKDSPMRKDLEQRKIITWAADQAASIPASLGEYFQEHGIQLSMLAPMLIGQSVVGVLGIASTEPSQFFNLQQVDFVERIAFDMASLTQDALLLDQALALATLGERDRLARELHDSVTQVLFTASLTAEVLPQIWLRDPEQGMQKLAKLRQLTRGALAEMRTMLIELRPSAVTNTPLGDLLAQLAEAVTSRSGLKFQLLIEQIPSLPENVQINFYRIAQEALNNVVKHAQASQVAVSLSITPLTPDSTGSVRHKIKLVIQDDGVGFSTVKKWSDKMGIGFMHERAATIQASLNIESRPGYGTQVTLIWSGELESQS